MTVLFSGPTNTREEDVSMATARQTAIYKSPDGTHHRIKEHATVPDGYEFMYAVGDLNDRPEVEDQDPDHDAPAPETKVQKAPKGR